MKDVLLAKVAVSAANFSIDKPYTYQIPETFAQQVTVGMRVLVPFGRGNRHTEGLVLALEQQEALPPRCKRILTALDDRPVLNQEGIQLALWMRERYFCSVYEAMRAMLPAGLYFSLKDRYVIPDGVTPAAAYAAAGQSQRKRQVLDALFAHGRAMERSELYQAMGTASPAAALRELVKGEVLTLETSVSRGVGDKTELVAQLAVPYVQAQERISPRAKQQQAAAAFLDEYPVASVKDIGYFTGVKLGTLRAMERKGLVTLTRQERYRLVDGAPVEPALPPELNEEQQAAYDGICQMLGSPGCALLYGVTGSGKTAVYIQLIHHVLAQGRQAMVLVPEIGLTPQLLRQFRAQFGEKVAVLHSSLSAGARYDEWKRARNGDAQVVIGTRSAVFAPLSNLGILILDEEQEGSYKSETVPRYHARDIAKYRCGRQNAVLVLGSATPSVETMYHAKAGNYQLFQLKQRFNQRALPEVFLTDMKEELRAGNNTTISALLRDKLTETIARREQAILFLNRRGTSRTAICAECGQVAECPRCSVKLTYHQANHRLMCHYCGYTQPLPDNCPQCGGAIFFVGAGVQQVETELQALFPDVKLLRMDADTVSASHPHEAILAQFERENIPILIGTQMVAKGLDFPNVTLVGVIDADLSLYVDDFRASERTFSLLTQVVGRAGRGSHPGSAVIQTFTPESDVITCAARQDYDQFYESEIVQRQLRRFPPFRDLYRIQVIGENEAGVLQCCMRLRESFLSWRRSDWMTDAPFDVVGPAAANVVKVMNRYRYALTLGGRDSKKLREMIRYVILRAKEDKQNRVSSITVDRNPMDSF